MKVFYQTTVDFEGKLYSYDIITPWNKHSLIPKLDTPIEYSYCCDHSLFQRSFLDLTVSINYEISTGPELYLRVPCGYDGAEIIPIRFCQYCGEKIELEEKRRLKRETKQVPTVKTEVRHEVI